MSASGWGVARELTDPTSRARFRRRLLLVVLLGAVVRIGFVVFVTGHQPIAQSDAYYYSAQAVTVGKGDGFVDPFNPGSTAPRADHPPLTAIVAAPATWLPDGTLFGQPLFQVGQKLTMALIGTLTVAMVGLIGRRLAGDRVGVVAAFFAALSPSLWVNDGLVMSESIGALTIAVVLWAALAAWDMRAAPREVSSGLRSRIAAVVAWPWMRWALLGAACGLATLARAEALLLVPILVIPLVAMRHRGAESALDGARWAGRLATEARSFGWKAAGRDLGLVAVGAGLVLMPWVGRNMMRFSEPTTLSTNDGLTLLGAYCKPALEGGAAGFWNLSCIGEVDTDHNGVNDWAEFEKGTLGKPDGPDASVYSAAYRRQGLADARANWKMIPDAAVIRVLRTWGLWRPGQMADFGRGEYRPRTVGMAGWATHMLSLPFAAIGVIALRRRGRPTWPFVAQAVAVTVVSALFYGQWRFRVGWDVAVCVLAAVGVMALPSLRRVWRERRAAPQVHPNGEFPALDGMRAVAMILVLLLHVGGASGSDRTPLYGRFFIRADIGLTVFFLLSGFLVTRPFLAAAVRGNDPPDTKRYLWRRVRRIYPAYWAALMIILLTVGVNLAQPNGAVVEGKPTPGLFALLLTLGNTARSVWATQGIPQAWSLGVELCFYLLVPALMWALYRRRPASPTTLLAAAAVMYVGGAAWRFWVAGAAPIWSTSAVYWLPTYLDIFAIGIALAAYSAMVAQGRPLPGFLDALARRPAWCWMGAFALFLVVVNPFEWHVWPMSVFAAKPSLAVLNVEFALRNTFYGAIAALALLPEFFGNQGSGWIRRSLESRPLVFLGRVSLGFYLWHVFWLTRVGQWLDAKPFYGPTVLLFVGTFALTLPTAIASFYLVERPLGGAHRNPRDAAEITSTQ